MRTRLSRSFIPGARGFSLLEVVAAVSIFAFGMVVVMGLFAPVTKSVANSGDSEAATRVADAVRARVQGLPFATALALIQLPADVRKNDGDGSYNPNDGTKHPAVLFGTRSGEVGIYDNASGRKAWYGAANISNTNKFADVDKYFEIDLVRNEEVSPASLDSTTAGVAYNIRVRWPAFVITTPGTAVQNGQNTGGSVAFDQGKKQVMFFTGAIAR